MNTPMPTPTATNTKTRIGMMQAVACNLCFAVYDKRRAAPDTSVANFVCKRCADEQPGEDQLTEKLHELNIQIETMGYQFEAMREELTAKEQTIALMTTELKKREEIENLTRSNKKVGNDAQRKNVSAHEGDPPTNNNPVNVNNNKNQKRKIFFVSDYTARHIATTLKKRIHSSRIQIETYAEGVNVSTILKDTIKKLLEFENDGVQVSTIIHAGLTEIVNEDNCDSVSYFRDFIHILKEKIPDSALNILSLPEATGECKKTNCKIQEII